jgi:hypothetical protein
MADLALAGGAVAPRARRIVSLPSLTKGGAPVAENDSLTRALDLLAAGSWQPAHEIVQKEASVLAAWLHGIVHTLEGDLDNARYWYRRAERVFPGAHAVQAEIAAARTTIEGKA